VSIDTLPELNLHLQRVLNSDNFIINRTALIMPIGPGESRKSNSLRLCKKKKKKEKKKKINDDR